MCNLTRERLSVAYHVQEQARKTSVAPLDCQYIESDRPVSSIIATSVRYRFHLDHPVSHALVKIIFAARCEGVSKTGRWDEPQQCVSPDKLPK